MSKHYSHLLSPLRIGNVLLKNRMFSANACPHFLQGPETFPAEGFMSYMTGIAKNGAAIINIGDWCNPNQRVAGLPDSIRMTSFDLTDPSVHNYLSQLADDIHFYGSKLLVSPNPGTMPEGYSFAGGKGGFGPPNPNTPDKKPFARAMMDKYIEEFVKKLSMYKGFGYDGFSTRLDLYLFPGINIRTDEFGGCMENRARFPKMLFSAIKEALGRDFIIEGVIAGEQPGRKGYKVEEIAHFACIMEDCMDILQIREEDKAKSHPTGYTYREGEHKVLEYAEAVKKTGTKVIVEPIGGFQNLEEMDRYIAEGKCDAIGLARAFICDSEYGKKALEGRNEDVVPCIKCNKCHGTMSAPWLSFCSVNPVMGIEHKLHRMLEPAGKAGCVAVIGGGPAGMEAALVAAKRGHSVTLYEKSDKLGGQLMHSEYSAFKWPIRRFKDYLIAQLAKNGVKVRLLTEPSPEDIRAGGFDAVFAATGAEPNIPDIPGLKNADGSAAPGIMACVDVYGRLDELGENVIIIGGSETGMETAMYLADNGRQVTVLTRQKELASDASKLHYVTMSWFDYSQSDTGIPRAAWEKYDNISGMTEVTATAVGGGYVTFTDKSGAEHKIFGDSVVVCGGMNPRLDDALRYSSAADRFFAIGDCNGAGNIQRCMRDAFSEACQL